MGLIQTEGRFVEGDFRVGAWLIQPKLNQICGQGVTVRIEPKIMQVLVCLAENCGEVVSKEQIIRSVWVDTFVTDDVLTRSISELRRAFADDPKQPRFIQTIPKGGYRLIAPVEWMGGNSTVHSIAVLPFSNANGNPDLDYLGEGITDCLIRALSQIPQLRVQSRSRVFRYRDQDGDPQAIGRELGVQSVVTGRVLQRNETLIVKAELVDVAEGWQRWSEQYSRTLSDIYAIEEDIAREIAETLHLRLTGEQKSQLAKRSTRNTEAYQLYLKARYFWHKGTEESVKKATSHFEEAIANDRNYALAHAGLADCYTFLGCQIDYGALRPREACPKAEAAARKALHIDDSLAEAHTSLACVLKNYYWDWPAAEREFQHAISLNPLYPKAHQSYADLLVALGRFKEAMQQIELAHELDPFSMTINTDAGTIYYLARDFESAIRQLRLTLELKPKYVPARSLLGLVYERSGMLKEAAAEFEKGLSLCKSSDVPVACVCQAVAASKGFLGRQGVEELEELALRRYVPACWFAVAYARLGETALTFEWIEKAYEERSNWLIYLNVDPALDGLRSEVRFQDLVRKVGLPIHTGPEFGPEVSYKQSATGK